MIIFLSLFLAASASVKSGKWNWEPAPPTTTTSTTTTTTTPITTTKWTGPPHLDPALKRSPWIPPFTSSDKDKRTGGGGTIEWTGAPTEWTSPSPIPKGECPGPEAFDFNYNLKSKNVKTHTDLNQVYLVNL